MRATLRLGTALALCGAVACGSDGGGAPRGAPTPSPLTVGTWSEVRDVDPAATFDAAVGAPDDAVVVGRVRQGCCAAPATVWRYSGGALAADAAFARLVKGRDVAVNAAAAAGGTDVVVGGGQDRKAALWLLHDGAWSKVSLSGLPATLDAAVTAAVGDGAGGVRLAVEAPSGEQLVSCDLKARRCEQPVRVGPAGKVRFAGTARLALAIVGEAGNATVWSARGPSWTWARSAPGATEAYAVAAAGEDMVLLGKDASGTATWRTTTGTDWRRTPSDLPGGTATVAATARGHVAAVPGPNGVAFYVSTDTAHWTAAGEAASGVADAEITAAVATRDEIVVVGTTPGPAAGEPFAVRATFS